MSSSAWRAERERERWTTWRLFDREMVSRINVVLEKITIANVRWTCGKGFLTLYEEIFQKPVASDEERLLSWMVV